MATTGTLKSVTYYNTVQNYTSEVEVYTAEGKGLVELIENNRMQSNECIQLLREYLDPMGNGIDQLVLGCTHYNFLIPVLQQLLPSHVHIINPAPAIGRQTKKLLETNNIQNKQRSKSQHLLYTTGKSELVKPFVSPTLTKIPIQEIQMRSKV